MSFLRRIFGRTSKEVTLTMCGLDQAGKTTIVNYLIHGEFRETVPTMGVNRETIDFPNIQFNVFDLGGQIDFRSLWGEINEKSDALIYVVDRTDYMRLDESKKIFHEIIDTQISSCIPVLILLNKVDLQDGISRVDFVKNFELLDPDMDINWAVFETSARTGQGIVDSFNWFVNALKDV
ncbi:MAG: GTP-binding protein [Candidatus Heimdallarchaeota archaeon]|nr:GTP-binding protein [Candidatus Heimdallarchaeota archaeon]